MCCQGQSSSLVWWGPSWPPCTAPTQSIRTLPEGRDVLPPPPHPEQTQIARRMTWPAASVLGAHATSGCPHRGEGRGGNEGWRRCMHALGRCLSRPSWGDAVASGGRMGFAFCWKGKMQV
jgi:hypothetical protein